ncbi:MAG: hypothetical protein FK733_02255 [Asgard group archaeon]|nr:hypothetical protein [Asgard group archaeon]
MSRDENLPEEITIRYKYGKITLLLAILCLSLTTVFSVTADDEQQVVIFKVLLETPEKQVIVDEIISCLEDLNLDVQTLYFTDVIEWRDYLGHYDLSYGGILALPRDGDIFLYSYVNVLMHYFAFSHTDAKIFKNVDKLWAMYWESVSNPDAVDADFIADMVNAFQDIEERMWEKQYISIFNRWVEPSSWEWGPIPTVKTEMIGYNCLPGYVFADKDLRLTLNAAINRDVFLDYHAMYNTYETHLTYHIFDWLPFHDYTLPNTFPN